MTSLGIVGYGEVGSAIGAGLARQGHGAIVAYDVLLQEGDPTLVIERAQTAQVELVDSLSELARRSRFIVSVVPGSECGSVASEIAPHLQRAHVFVDLAAAPADFKRSAVETVLDATPATVADGAIMSSAAQDGHRMKVLLSGPGSPAFRDEMLPWGMDITVVGARFGDASMIKSMRSVFTKGLEALLMECLVASDEFGVLDSVLASISTWVDSQPFDELARMLVVTDSIHAHRRASEVAMSADLLARTGLGYQMAEAATNKLHSLATLELGVLFKGKPPDELTTVITTVREREVRPNAS